MKLTTITKFLALSFVLLYVTTGDAGPSPAAKCQAAKLTEAGKLGACLLKAESKAAKKGTVVDLGKCELKFADTWAKFDSKSGGACPTLGDDDLMASVVDAHRAEILERLGGLYGDIVDSAVNLEIAGIIDGGGTRNVVLVQGPGFLIDRVEGFDGSGQPFDTPGFSTDIPLVFENIPPASGADNDGIALANAFVAQQAGSFGPRAASVIVRNQGNSEVARWNVYEIAPVEMSVGTDGRDRYKWQSQIPAPTIANSEFAGGTFNPALADDFNPATDNPVEVGGIGTYYPEVTDNPTARFLTLRLFYNETQSLFQWAREARNGSVGVKRAVSVLTVDPDTQVEQSRRNYFGVFPVSYRLVSGFSLPESTVIEVVLSYDVAEQG